MNNLRQNFYRYVTNPIAKILDFVNIPKQLELKRRRKEIAWQNKKDYIETTSKVLFETELQEQLNEGKLPNPIMLPLIIARHVEKAHKMFYEKKKNGDFDELNIMLK